jgi:hypothetical protein
VRRKATKDFCRCPRSGWVSALHGEGRSLGRRLTGLNAVLAVALNAITGDARFAFSGPPDHRPGGDRAVVLSCRMSRTGVASAYR